MYKRQTQYLLHIQLKEVKEYAHQHQVVLKGDIPIGISRNSVEAWVEPHLFNLDVQTGAPPDDFSFFGQNWGFPTYNWDEMAKDGYQWWVKRFRKMADYFDAYRIDHILGFFRIWEIPLSSVQGLLAVSYTHLDVYKRQGLLTAILSPLINSALFGMPPVALLPAILIKSTLLAGAAAYAAHRLEKISLLGIIAAVLTYQIAGTLIEWAIVKDFFTAVQAVSYTHLDVYKRQSQSLSCSTFPHSHIQRFAINDFNELSICFSREYRMLFELRTYYRQIKLFYSCCKNNRMRMPPVSYTHLDVYKRQPCHKAFCNS